MVNKTTIGNNSFSRLYNEEEQLFDNPPGLGRIEVKAKSPSAKKKWTKIQMRAIYEEDTKGFERVIEESRKLNNVDAAAKKMHKANAGRGSCAPRESYAKQLEPNPSPLAAKNWSKLRSVHEGVPMSEPLEKGNVLTCDQDETQ